MNYVCDTIHCLVECTIQGDVRNNRKCKLVPLEICAGLICWCDSKLEIWDFGADSLQKKNSFRLGSNSNADFEICAQSVDESAKSHMTGGASNKDQILGGG